MMRLMKKDKFLTCFPDQLWKPDENYVLIMFSKSKYNMINSNQHLQGMVRINASE